MIKAAIVGCGTIADAHADIIQSIKGSEIIAVCDSEELMAKQMHERFGTKYYFKDIKELLEVAKPDVVHITTPPQSHYSLGKLCLEAGSNVYIEKPFTLNATEAEDLIELAKKNSVKATAGHNLQFSHATMRMRKYVNDGYLGGAPVHMESIYCYDFGDARYAKSVLGDKNHWVRKLPGKLLHNIISHGICRIAEFINNDDPTVVAYGFTSPLLKSIDETEIIDELRVTIIDKDQTTAYFTFSSQMSPKRRQFRIYGPKNSLFVDDDHQTLILDGGGKYKSYLDQFIPQTKFAGQYLQNSFFNMKKFMFRDFHMSHGMRNLIKAFYQSISEGDPLPISYKEILVTAKIMDDIFDQINLKQNN